MSIKYGGSLGYNQEQVRLLTDQLRELQLGQKNYDFCKHFFNCLYAAGFLQRFSLICAEFFPEIPRFMARNFGIPRFTFFRPLDTYIYWTVDTLRLHLNSQ